MASHTGKICNSKTFQDQSLLLPVDCCKKSTALCPIGIEVVYVHREVPQWKFLGYFAAIHNTPCYQKLDKISLDKFFLTLQPQYIWEVASS
jgi:hypothetical protein